ncbi:MAG: DUF1272 domain-containing protein [Bacteroidia bacterium]
MLELRPVCENCAKPLPNESSEAMICTFECTFCKDCVTDVLKNVCPNCGGGFEKRPTRPVTCVTKHCISNYPVTIEKKHRPVDMEKFKSVQNTFINIEPHKR